MNALILSSLLSVRSSKALCLLLLIGLLPGCLHDVGVRPKDVHGPLPPPPSESLRAELGTVWVASSLAQPGLEFVQTPASGLWSGLGRGAHGGALFGCEIVGVPAFYFGGMFGPVLAIAGCVGGGTVGAISGGIYGAIAAEPAKTVDAVMATVRNTLMSSEIQQRVQDHVRELMTTRIHVPQATSDESAAATRLETELLSIQLDGLPPSANMYGSVGVINPSVRLVVTAQARLIRTHDKGELYVARFQYWGARMTIPEWASNDAQPVRDGIDRAALALAEQIVDAVFLLHR
jgi:hypothetical protein